MQYTEYDKLTIYHMKDSSDYISMVDIGELLLERPSNMVYCIKAGKLEGIISMGDFHRADKKSGKVKINRNFTKLSVGEYMRAKRIFKENEKINALPVVDEEGHLLGDYTRWDSLRAAERYLPLLTKDMVMWFIERFQSSCESILLVCPTKEFSERYRLFELYKNRLESFGLEIKCVTYKELGRHWESSVFAIFIEENERRGISAYYREIEGMKISGRGVVVCSHLGEESVRFTRKKTISMRGAEQVEKFFEYLRSLGVSILGIQSDALEKENRDVFRKKVEKKYAAIGKRVENNMPEELQEAFFGELYSKDYANQILKSPRSIELRKGVPWFKDVASPLFHVMNGERLTIGQPEAYDSSVYFFGPCMMVGAFVEDKYTIESCLQEIFNQKGEKIRIVNCGCYEETFMSALKRLIGTKLKRGDMVVIYTFGAECHGILKLSLFDIVEENQVPVEWVTNSVNHVNHKVNQLYAKAIYEKIKDYVNPSQSGEKIEITYEINVEQAYFEFYRSVYFADFHPEKHRKIGAIVMNCNPFTNGHRYLIEEAVKQVDFLIIFVVEEDRSVFTFEERFACVKAGVADLDNVKVVPSGEYILSQITFPEYFIKIADEDIHRNTEYDITLFAEQLAPMLHITHRFVGEEPEDVVTNTYNDAMKKILPKYGIELVEIPRKQQNGSAISATTVRKCLEEKDFEHLKKLVPESTLKVLGNI